MNREDFIAKHPLDAELTSRGVKLIGQAPKLKAKCPFHEDKTPSLSLDLDRGLWNCHAGCGGGSVIDLIARFENKTPGLVLSEASEGASGPSRAKCSQPKEMPVTKATIGTIYQYRDALNRDAYQVVRMVPKTFRQRHMKGDAWVWNMEGVERVLYRLPEIMQAEEIVVVEGEKDADNLVALGFCATCNVGGAGKWMNGYTDSLAGKRVVLCGDNDDAGRKHMDMVFESLAGKVAEVRFVNLPKEFKDVSDWIAATIDPVIRFKAMRDSAAVFYKGIRIPIRHFADLEDHYIRHAQAIDNDGVSLSDWLPGFADAGVRRLLPGELAIFLAATGVGKTAILSNIAMAARQMRTIFFELELPATLLFERLVAMRSQMPCVNVEAAYKAGERIGRGVLTNFFPNLYVSTESKFNVETIEQTISRSELIMGQRPQLVLLDYIGLIRGIGSSRYDRVSQIAEDLKVMAKATNTVVICACQVSRKSDDAGPEIFLNDAKDSGSIENSAGLVVGAWRREDDSTKLDLRILKNTKGKAGSMIHTDYHGPNLRITQSTSAVG